MYAHVARHALIEQCGPICVNLILFLYFYAIMLMMPSPFQIKQGWKLHKTAQQHSYSISALSNFFYPVTCITALSR